MKWKLPPKIKIYEALGSIGDGRVRLNGNLAKVSSSSGDKAYDVAYDPKANAIMSNDNGSYWQGYLGYPSIAFLMAKGVIAYDTDCAKLLSGVLWKDINTKFKNDWGKTEKYVLDNFKELDRKFVIKQVDEIYIQIKQLKINTLGKKQKPPSGY